MPSLTRLDPVRVAKLSKAEKCAASEALAERNLREARASAGAFVEYAIPHEQGGPVVNAPHHIEWHKHLDENARAVIFAPVEHAKTQQIAIGRAIWMLGTNPDLRIGIISNTSTQAEKILGSIAQHIERNPLVHRVFPHLKPSQDGRDPWNQQAITVERKVIAKDPSVQALGIGGAAIVGSRLDIIIVDDILDFENTRTVEQLTKLLDWFDSTVDTRLVAGGVIWVIGTPWARTDLLHVLEARPGWASKRYSAVDNPDDPEALWRPLWPEQFSRERLADKAANTTPFNFARKYLCRVHDDASARFKGEWIEAAKQLGKGRMLLNRAPLRPSGIRIPCFTGVDLGVGQKQGHDLTVLFTVAAEEKNRRVVADIQAGRWSAPDILSRIHQVWHKFDSIIVVEDNAAQAFLVQWAQEAGIPVRPFTTGKNKYDEHFGIESLAVEMRSGMWVIPSGATGQDVAEEVRAWIQEMLFYSPDAHTGDRLMASWFAREAIRGGQGKVASKQDLLAR